MRPALERWLFLSSGLSREAPPDRPRDRSAAASARGLPIQTGVETDMELFGVVCKKLQNKLMRVPCDMHVALKTKGAVYLSSQTNETKLGPEIPTDQTDQRYQQTRHTATDVLQTSPKSLSPES